MDYKYISQLLERYWQCQTTIEEEEILKMFFSQKDVPASLLPYKSLFVYTRSETADTVLGDDFDEKILQLVNEPATVKARRVTLTQQLRPLFRAAAVIAIVLTIGNAAQLPFKNDTTNYANVEGFRDGKKGTSVAMRDSMVTDTLKHSGNISDKGL